MFQYPSEEDQIEWAKRESERAEEERLARLNQQEQEDLELAIALSKSEISEAWCAPSQLLVALTRQTNDVLTKVFSIEAT